MISFYQVDESGGTSAVTLGEASEGFAIQDQYHEDVLTSNLDFDTVVDAGIYRYESIGDSSQHVPSDASSGYVFVFAESDKHSTRSIVQIAFDDNGGVLVRRGAISEDTGTTIGAWEDLNASGSSTFAISSTSPAGTVGGSWSVVSGYEDVGIWKQVNIIMTLADAVNTTILLDVATFALSGTQTIYVSNGDGTFSPLLLDIINGGTGANSAAGARTALGAASQADLNSLRDSVNNYIGYFSRIYPSPYTYPANTVSYVDFDLTEIEEWGWQVFGVISASTSHGSVVIQGIRVIEDHTVRLECRNLLSSSVAATPQIRVLARMFISN